MTAPKKADWRRRDYAELIVRLQDQGILESLLEICRGYHVRFDDVLEHLRSRSIVLARRDCYVYLRSLGWSYPEIGRAMMRDHVTVLYAIKKYEKENGVVLRRQA